MTGYAEFLASKEPTAGAALLRYDPGAIHPSLFDFQRHIVTWAVGRGRAAVWATTGMGKTRMQLEWARLSAERALIVAPLAVCEQTVREARVLGIDAAYVRDDTEAAGAGMWVTNYERVTAFDPALLDAVVLDEASILKQSDGRTRTTLIRHFADVPRRLACTATPAPNDPEELTNQAAWLGIMPRNEMLAAYFVHDQNGWRLKGHARQPMFRWMATWAVALRAPSDLGFADAGYELPPLDIIGEPVSVNLDGGDALFPMLGGVGGRAKVRRDTLDARVARTVEIVNESHGIEDGSRAKLAACGSPNMPTSGEPSTAPIPRSGNKDAPIAALPSRTVSTCGGTTETTLRSISALPSKRSTGTLDGGNATPTTLNTGKGVRLKPEGATLPSSEPTVSADSSASGPASSMPSSLLRADGVPSARLSLETPPGDGSPLTTVIGPAESEAFSVGTVTSVSGSSGMIPNSSSEPWSTSGELEPWVIWCGLNAEQEALEKAFGDRAISISGSLSPDEKVSRLYDWIDGKRPILISKASMLGFGINMQRCARMVFVGLNDSYETYFQAIRRCWRYGQTRAVRAHVVVSDLEGQIVANVRRKEAEAEAMTAELVTAMQAAGQTRTEGDIDPGYITDEASGDGWRLMLGDSAERLGELADSSVHLSVYSPPFASLYTYSPSLRDLGNSKDRAEFFRHYAWIIAENLRVTVPGRLVAVHVQQVSTTKATHGMQKLTDFRGEVIRAYEAEGWWYVREVCIDKDPQAQAIRTKAHNLMFQTKNKDSSRSWPALADYLLIFQKPGDNAEPVKTDVTNDEWILWARPVWYDIRESDTLNVAAAREQADERHIAPLQLSLIERAVRLWTNRGETVLSPFAGIGSEGFSAIKLGRRFVGCELKPSYWRTAIRNLRAAEREGETAQLFEA